MIHVKTERPVFYVIDNFCTQDEEILHKDFLIKRYKIRLAAHECKIRKTPGADKIKAQNFLSKLFNACISIKYFHASWKCVKVFPILKIG